jgi:hypothetical protein
MKKDNEDRTCTPIDVISANKNVIKKEAERFSDMRTL